MIPSVSFENSSLRYKDLDVDRFSGVMDRAGDMIFIPHRSNFYKIFYFERGHGRINVDFVEKEVGEGNILFIARESVYWFEDIDNLDGVVVMFSADFIAQMSSIFILYFFLDLHKSKWQDSIVSLIDVIYHEFKAPAQHSVALEEYLLNSLLILLKRNLPIKQERDGDDQQIYFQFRDLVESGYTLKKSILEYSRQLAVSERKLNRLCKKYNGSTPGKIVEERIVLEAKRLLSYNNMRINEIAHQLGFSDDSYFVKFFKKHVKMTPKEFKAVCRLAKD